MSLSIIQISDIHLKENNNSIFDRWDKFIDACISRVLDDDDVVLLISGDIAFSGKKTQYEIANTMIDKLTTSLQEKKHCRVHYVFAPGNHDCDFEKETSIRSSLISTINNDADLKIYEAMTEIQSEYYSFCHSYNLNDNNLISKVDFVFNNKKVLFLIINSAWMSVIEENPGRIIVPDCFIPEVNNREYSAVFTVMHHPINWYNPDYQKPIVDFIRKNTDLLFVGHEHIVDTINMSGIKWSIKEIKAQELQDSDSFDSGFFVLNFDDSFKNYYLNEFKWNNDTDKKLFERVRKSEEVFLKTRQSTIRCFNLMIMH